MSHSLTTTVTVSWVMCHTRTVPIRGRVIRYCLKYFMYFPLSLRLEQRLVLMWLMLGEKTEMGQIRLNNCDDSRIIACSTAAVAQHDGIATAENISADHQHFLWESLDGILVYYRCLKMSAKCGPVLLVSEMVSRQCWWCATDRNDTNLDDNHKNYNKYFAIIHTNVVTQEFYSLWQSIYCQIPSRSEIKSKTFLFYCEFKCCGSKCQWA